MESILSPQRRSQIAAVLAERGGCVPLARRYAAECRGRFGVAEAELARNREGYAQDPLTEAALRFAHAALIAHGRLQPRDVRALRRCGADDADVAALVALAAHVAGEIIAANAGYGDGAAAGRSSARATSPPTTNSTSPAAEFASLDV
jgi:hypothetical protein